MLQVGTQRDADGGREKMEWIVGSKRRGREIQKEIQKEGRTVCGLQGDSAENTRLFCTIF